MIDTSTQIGILFSVNSLLFVIAGFFIKSWIKGISSDSDDNKTELKEHKEYIIGEVDVLKREIGKRKGETELLRKDMERLSLETNMNFENLKTHMEYQKTSLDEIKKSLTKKDGLEVKALISLIEKMNKDDNKGK